MDTFFDRDDSDDEYYDDFGVLDTRSRRYGSAPPDFPSRSRRRRDRPLPLLVTHPPCVIKGTVDAIPPYETTFEYAKEVVIMLAEEGWHAIRQTYHDAVYWAGHDAPNVPADLFNWGQQYLLYTADAVTDWVEREGWNTALDLVTWVWHDALRTLRVTLDWLRFLISLTAVLVGMAAVVAYGGSQYYHYQAYSPLFYDDFAPSCPPTFLYYPQYPAALDLPVLSPSLYGLTVNGRTANWAYKKQLICYDARKWRRHPRLTEANTTHISILLLDSHGKLQLGVMHPKLVMDPVKLDLVPLQTSPIWNATIAAEHTPNARRTFQTCKQCSLQEALLNAAWHMVIPAILWPPLPSTLDEAEATKWCPCTISAALAPFTFVFNFRTWTWRDDNLPPLGIHGIWFDDSAWVVKSVSLYDVPSHILYKRFLARLRAHGKTGYRSELDARRQMSCADKRAEVLAGRMSSADLPGAIDGCIDDGERQYLGRQRWKSLRGVEAIWKELFRLEVRWLDLT